MEGVNKIKLQYLESRGEKNGHVLIGLEREEILVRPSLQTNPKSVAFENQHLASI